MAIPKVADGGRRQVRRRTMRSRTMPEDCVSFNPKKVEVKRTGGRWKIVEGSHWILDFATKEWEAHTALAIIKKFGFNKICFVGRPGPSMTYFLVDGSAPRGSMSGEDAVFFNPRRVQVKRIVGRWKIVEGDHWLLDFGSKKSEAETALSIIKKYRFNKMCFVGRPDPSMTYFMIGRRAKGFATKWVIPEMRIKLEWNSSSTDPALRKVKNLCTAFNVRLFDATDGQCRVAKFSIYDKSTSLSAQAAGVGNVYKSGTINCIYCSQHGHSNGRPNNPSHVHVRLQPSNSQLRQQAGTMFMEWCHSYTGTRDEYETITGGSSSCPSSASVRAANDACIMYQTGSYSELCRPPIHNSNTEQGQDREMSCYEWIQKVMTEAGKGYWQVPSRHIPGPEDPIVPQFVYYF